MKIYSKNKAAVVQFVDDLQSRLEPGSRLTIIIGQEKLGDYSATIVIDESSVAMSTLNSLRRHHGI